jgi:hypothetical protein
MLVDKVNRTREGGDSAEVSIAAASGEGFSADG